MPGLRRTTVLEQQDAASRCADYNGKEDTLGCYLMFGHCIGCGRLFGFNPHKVPSLLVDNVREPVCLDCVNRVNPVRRAKGLEEIVPLPGAYDPESEGDYSDDDLL